MHLFVACSCHGLQSASFVVIWITRCFFIAKSCHGIIIVEGWKVLLFDAWRCHGITKFLFFSLRVVIWVTRCILLLIGVCYGIIIVMGLESVSFCCLELSRDNKVHLFIAWSCHGIIIVVGLESASFCCYLDNKAHLFRSCHGIIIVVGMESASFCCLELSWDNKVLLFLS